MKYVHAAAMLAETIWALKEETLTTMQAILAQRSEGARWSAEEVRDRISEANATNGYVRVARDGARFLAADEQYGLPAGKGGGILMEGPTGTRNAAAPGSVGVIPIVGIISHRLSLMSDMSGPGVGASIQRLSAQFSQALDDVNCKSIVFDVDSPGGSVDGVMELASFVYSARSYKNVFAVVNSMACSAAYWLASAASKVIISPSGQCGSIGVYMTHQDESEALAKDGIKITLIKAGKYKTEGNSAEPLSDEARAAFQSKVDSYYGMFVQAVAKNRKTAESAVRSGYGQGRSVLAGDAVKQDLADRVGTLEDVLASLGVGVSGKRRAKIDNGRMVASMRNQLAMYHPGIASSQGSTTN
jgi:signal peptide peptidase SppA